MAIKLRFDSAGNPELPTIILARKNGDKICQLITDGLVLSGNDAGIPAEMYFTTYKNSYSLNDWNAITNFKLVWCKEWNKFFEITVDINERNYLEKKITCKELAQAELSQINLNGIEINTENDIARDDYKEPTVFWSQENPEASLLHRLMKDKVQHYGVAFVDSTLHKIQRTFSFDGVSVYDALQQIAEEIGCVFEYTSRADSNGRILRNISAYDLNCNCLNCNYRGEHFDICPKCGSTNIKKPYGRDTGILVSAGELTNEINFTTDTASVKNCFKLEAGDDLMNATIRNINPNGSDYIWYLSEETRNEMSPLLSSKLGLYDELYKKYQKDSFDILPGLLYPEYKEYASLVDKYRVYDPNIKKVTGSANGYNELITNYYSTIDFCMLLQSSLLPKIEKITTDAKKEAAKITSVSLSPVACADVSKLSQTTANNLVLSQAKVLIDGNYRLKVTTSSLGGSYWNGCITLENYSDEKDTAQTEQLSVKINDNYELFVKQKIDKLLAKKNINDVVSIKGIFDNTLPTFKTRLKDYSLDYLSILQNSCQSCIDILIEQGIADKETWANTTPNLYNDLYLDYVNKLNAINDEIKLRDSEIEILVGKYDKDGNVIRKGILPLLEKTKDTIRKELDLEKYLGGSLWAELMSFRREDTYSNSNYISDGLNNAEIVKKAEEFLDVASKEIYKSATLQHKISTTLNNLLMNKKFESIVDNFEVGSKIRVEVDGKIYTLRLTHYELDFNDVENIQVEFSDVISIADDELRAIKDAQKASSMTSTYDCVKRQANKGDNSNNILNGWFEKGLDATKTKIVLGAENQVQSWDEHGMLFRQYDDILDSYNDRQMKILNSSIIMTDDNWNTVKTAVGLHYYINPKTNKLESAYGVNGEVLVGKLILGEKLGIYSDNNQLTFNGEGLKVTNGRNTFVVNPNDLNSLLKISNDKEDLLYVDNLGMLHLAGDGAGIDIGKNATISKMALDFHTAKDNFETRISANEQGILASVSKSELGQQVNSYLSMTSDIIDMKSGLITWTANNSSMDRYGTLTCNRANLNNATVSGTITTDNGKHKTIMSNGNMKVYHDNIFVGLIGANGYKDLAGIKGLNFDLESTGHYMTWASADSPTAQSYAMKWTYTRDAISQFPSNSLNAGCDVYIHGFNMHEYGTMYFDKNKNTYICELAGNLHIGTVNSGDIKITTNIDMIGNSILNQSDERLKRDIIPMKQDALSMLNQIDIVEYNWRKTGKKVYAGMIAQQLQTIIPNTVNVDKDGIYSIKTMELIPYIIKAIQQLAEAVQIPRSVSGFYSVPPAYVYNQFTQTEIDNAMRLVYDLKKVAEEVVVTHN